MEVWIFCGVVLLVTWVSFVMIVRGLQKDLALLQTIDDELREANKRLRKLVQKQLEIVQSKNDELHKMRQGGRRET